MNISLFGYTIEVHISKGEYNRRFAGKLLTQAHSYTSNQVGYKIALIKALRIEKDISRQRKLLNLCSISMLVESQ